MSDSPAQRLFHVYLQQVNGKAGVGFSAIVVDCDSLQREGVDFKKVTHSGRTAAGAGASGDRRGETRR